MHVLAMYFLFSIDLQLFIKVNEGLCTKSAVHKT